MKMVTRTVVETLVDCMVYNKVSGNIDNGFILTMPEKFSTKELEKYAAALNMIILEVNGTHKRETLYGMSEEEFIKHSVILPPRGTKAQ